MGCAGAIGVIIPPSITFVVYGLHRGQPPSATCSRRASSPGLIMGAALIIAARCSIGRKLKLEVPAQGQLA